MGETMGVATNSKGHLFVYSRTNPQGIARGGAAAMLWEFDRNGKFVKEWGPHNYAASFAHAVRVDRDDNVWQVDEGSGMIVKYNPKGQQDLLAGPDAGSDRLPGSKSGSPEIRPPGPWPRTGGRSAARASSTAKPTSPGIRKATSSYPTVTAIRAWSRFRPMAIG